MTNSAILCIFGFCLASTSTVAYGSHAFIPDDPDPTIRQVDTGLEPAVDVVPIDYSQLVAAQADVWEQVFDEVHPQAIAILHLDGPFAGVSWGSTGVGTTETGEVFAVQVVGVDHVRWDEEQLDLDQAQFVADVQLECQYVVAWLTGASGTAGVYGIMSHATIDGMRHSRFTPFTLLLHSAVATHDYYEEVFFRNFGSANDIVPDVNPNALFACWQATAMTQECAWFNKLARDAHLKTLRSNTKWGVIGFGVTGFVGCSTSWLPTGASQVACVAGLGGLGTVVVCSQAAYSQIMTEFELAMDCCCSSAGNTHGGALSCSAFQTGPDCNPF